MNYIIVYWALIIANEPGFVGSIHRTYEPCQNKIVELRKAGIDSACYPTTHPDILSASEQLKSLGRLFYANSN